MEVDLRQPGEILKACQASILKGYLFWRVEHSRIKKESSIITCWKVLSMVYARLAKRYMDEGILYDIRNVCRLSLSPEHYHTDSVTVDPALSNSFFRP